MFKIRTYCSWEWVTHLKALSDCPQTWRYDTIGYYRPWTKWTVICCLYDSIQALSCKLWEAINWKVISSKYIKYCVTQPVSKGTSLRWTGEPLKVKQNAYEWVEGVEKVHTSFLLWAVNIGVNWDCSSKRQIFFIVIIMGHFMLVFVCLFFLLLPFAILFLSDYGATEV